MFNVFVRDEARRWLSNKSIRVSESAVDML